MIKITVKTNKSNIEKLINIEVDTLNVSLSSQKVLSKQILLFLKNFIGNIEVDSIFSKEINDFISLASENLNKINSNIDSYNSLLEILDNLQFNHSTLEFKTIVSKINQYNKKYTSSTDKIFKITNEIQDFIHSMSLIDISEYLSIENIDSIIQPKDEKNETITETPEKTSKKKKKNVSLVENTLIISEIEGLITLPYKISDLKKVLRKQSDKYSSLSDIVLSLYTLPLKNYKFSAFARFREAYKLIMNKEKRYKKRSYYFSY